MACADACRGESAETCVKSHGITQVHEHKHCQVRGGGVDRHLSRVPLHGVGVYRGGRRADRLRSHMGSDQHGMLKGTGLDW